MPEPRATIAFVPREVFAGTRRSLEAIYERTREPFHLVCVDGGSPPTVAEYLRSAAAEKGFTLLRAERYLAPNEARNLALTRVKTPYVAFVDNDVLVAQGWLRALCDCADQTGAWAVGPLTFEREPEGAVVHLFGGVCRVETRPDGRRSFFERPAYAHTPVAEIRQVLSRRETEILEFHTMLVRSEAFTSIGLLDERLLSMFEYCDLCMQIRALGRKVMLEPASRVTYLPPTRLEPSDREFFELRWSEAWVGATIERMIEKWALSPDDPEMDRARRWVGGHRRLGNEPLRMLRRTLGRKLARSVEKRLAPIEAVVNRRRYPSAIRDRFEVDKIDRCDAA